MVAMRRRSRPYRGSCSIVTAWAAGLVVLALWLSMIAAVGLASRPTRSRSAMFEPHPASIQDRDGGGPLLPYPLLSKTRWMKGKMRRETPSRARGLSVQKHPSSRQAANQL